MLFLPPGIFYWVQTSLC